MAVDLLAQNLNGYLINLLEWFENNYLGRINRNSRRRRNAHYLSEFWKFL